MKIAKVVNLDFDLFIFDKHNTNYIKDAVINYSDLPHKITSDLGIKIDLDPCISSSYKDNTFNQFKPLILQDLNDEEYYIPYSFIGLINVIKATPSINSFKEVLKKDNTYINYLNDLTLEGLELFKTKTTEKYWTNLDSILNNKVSRTYKYYNLSNEYEEENKSFKTNKKLNIINDKTLPDKYVRITIKNKIKRDVYLAIENKITILGSYKGSDFDNCLHLKIEHYEKNKPTEVERFSYTVDDILLVNIPAYFTIEECNKNIKENTFEQLIINRKTKEFEDEYKHRLEVIEQEINTLRKELKTFTEEESFNSKIQKLVDTIENKNQELINLETYKKMLIELDMLSKDNSNINNIKKLINITIKAVTLGAKIKSNKDNKTNNQKTGEQKWVV